jgi:hypothetical protein
MNMYLRWLAVINLAGCALAQRTERQNFDDGRTDHRFFVHTFEYVGCCLEVVPHPQLKGAALHLVPNSDVVTLRTAPGEVVHSFTLVLLDFEGGFVGYSPTSAAVVRGAHGDFIVLHADALGEPQELSADRFALGQLSGEPIGPIVEIGLQAANEGNSVVPGVGAYFDDLAAVVLDACPGDTNADRTVDLLDLAIVLTNFGTPLGARYADGDFDSDGDVDLADLSALLVRFGQTCD